VFLYSAHHSVPFPVVTIKYKYLGGILACRVLTTKLMDLKQRDDVK